MEQPMREFPELPMVQALRWQIAGDRDAATRAVAWAVGPGDEVRQLRSDRRLVR